MGRFLRIVLLLINVVCAALLVLSTLTVWLAPSQMRLPSLLSYACPYLFIVNVLWVIGWLCFARKEFLLSAIVIVARFGFVPQFVQLSGTSEVPVSDTALRVMAFNVHGFVNPDDTLAPADDVGRFVALIRAEQPDVVTLEEYRYTHEYRLLDTMLSLGYRHYRGVKDYMAGIVVYSK